MIKFLAAVILVSLVTQSGADDINQTTDRPLYDYLRGSPIRKILDFASGLRDLLKNPALTKRLVKIRNSLPNLADKLMTCGQTIVFNAMNKRNSSIGEAMSIFRLGNQNEIKKPSDVYSYVFALPITFLYFSITQDHKTYQQRQQLNIEMRGLSDELHQKCYNIIPSGLKGDYDALATLVEKYNYGSHQ